LVLKLLVGLLNSLGAVGVDLFESGGVKGSDEEYLLLLFAGSLLLYFLHYNYYTSN
jgi:hypothetical protein